MIGVEILNASKFLRDAVLEPIQAKTLRILESEPARYYQHQESWNLLGGKLCLKSL